MATIFPKVCDMMAQLAKVRPIFHSEKDFQHALAWELHKYLEGNCHFDAKFFLERPLKAGGKAVRLDMLVVVKGESLAVELKFKKERFKCEVCDDIFILARDSAQNWGGYKFIEDVSRLEQIASSQEMRNCTGWAVFLTNDSIYWKNPTKADAMGAASRISDERKLEGKIPKPDGSDKGMEKQLELSGRYVLGWQNFYNFGKTGGEFRYLAVNVAKPS